MSNENLIQLIYNDMQEMKKQQMITNERLAGMDQRFEGIDQRFERMDRRFDSLEAKVLKNTEEIQKINLCLENEIRPSIMRVAEGHLDLSRKLDEALKIDQEKENMALRLNFLEGKVGRLEAAVASLV